MTLRARLTLWYSGLLAAVLLIFGIAVYGLLSFLLTQQVNDTLERTAEDIASTASVMVDRQAVFFPGATLQLTAGVGVQLFRADGESVHEDRGLEALELPSSESPLTRATYRTETLEGMSYRVLTYPLILQPEETLVGYLQLARPMDAVEAALKNLVVVMLLGGTVAVLLTALVVWSTASTALRPLDEVTETALSITRADDLSRRIPFTGPPNDEVGRLTAAFNETLERLDGLFESQRRFLADVSHELRTPLTSIRGNVDLLKRMDEHDPESLETIRTEVDRMTRMVNDLLILAQAETGRLPLARDRVELDTLMLEVFAQAKVLANGVNVEIGREDQVQVFGDRDKLKQVLLNLVSNAIHHTPSGGTVTMALTSEDGQAHLTVADSGGGIPEDELPYIFERFYRVDRSRSRSDPESGAGLGLSIAHAITRGHGGRIEVESEEGAGSTFSVWLPLADGHGGALA